MLVILRWNSENLLQSSGAGLALVVEILTLSKGMLQAKSMGPLKYTYFRRDKNQLALSKRQGNSMISRLILA